MHFVQVALLTIKSYVKLCEEDTHCKSATSQTEESTNDKQATKSENMH